MSNCLLSHTEFHKSLALPRKYVSAALRLDSASPICRCTVERLTIASETSRCAFRAASLIASSRQALANAREIVANPSANRGILGIMKRKPSSRGTCDSKYVWLSSTKILSNSKLKLAVPRNPFTCHVSSIIASALGIKNIRGGPASPSTGDRAANHVE